MSIIIYPEIRKTSDLPYHTDDAPGDRIVFAEKQLLSTSEFYVMGRRVKTVPQNQPEYIHNHKHSCNSFHILIGDNDDLTGLEAYIDIEGQTRELISPSTFFIPSNLSHHYKLTKGSGWFFNILLDGDFVETLIPSDESGLKSDSILFQDLYKKAEKNLQKVTISERPLTTTVNSILNPTRWIFVDPNLFYNPGAYIAVHQISSNDPFQYKMKMHHHITDEIYILLGRKNSELEINLVSDDKIERIKSPAAIYHPKHSNHRYEYVNGEGIILIVLKENIVGEGYKFILK